MGGVEPMIKSRMTPPPQAVVDEVVYHRKEAFSMIEQQCNGKKVPSGIKKLITPEFIDRGSVAKLD